MYFPKSQIKTNQITTGGEFQYLSSGEEYIGPYFETSTGKYYSGINPQSDNINELVPLNNINEVQKYDADDDPIGSWGRENSVYLLDEAYLGSTKLDFSQEAPLPPSNFVPKPSEKNYETGEIVRFFASKINEPRFIEIDVNQYKSYINKAPLTQYRLYKVFTLFWQITGDRNKVYNVNKNSVELVSKRERIPSFPSYFKGKFDQFYKEVGS